MSYDENDLTQADIDQVKSNLEYELVQIAANTKPLGAFDMFAAVLLDNVDFQHQIICLLSAGLCADRDAANEIMAALVDKMTTAYTDDKDRFDNEVFRLQNEDHSDDDTRNE